MLQLSREKRSSSHIDSTLADSYYQEVMLYGDTKVQIA